MIHVYHKDGRLAYTYSGSNPNWTGPPSAHRIATINALTMADSKRLYFRITPHDGWRHLRKSDYPLLNRSIDAISSPPPPPSPPSPPPPSPSPSPSNTPPAPLR